MMMTWGYLSLICLTFIRNRFPYWLQWQVYLWGITWHPKWTLTWTIISQTWTNPWPWTIWTILRSSRVKIQVQMIKEGNNSMRVTNLGIYITISNICITLRKTNIIKITSCIQWFNRFSTLSRFIKTMEWCSQGLIIFKYLVHLGNFNRCICLKLIEWHRD